MKRTLLVMLLCVVAASAAFAAPGGRFGLGLFVGQPSGIDFEVDATRSSWFDFKFGWSFLHGKPYSLMFQANYEYAFVNAFGGSGVRCSPFLGVGLIAALYETWRDGRNTVGFDMGMRLPMLGLSCRFTSVPIELFIDAALDIYFVPGFFLSGSGGLGMRFRF